MSSLKRSTNLNERQANTIASISMTTQQLKLTSIKWCNRANHEDRARIFLSEWHVRHQSSNITKLVLQHSLKQLRLHNKIRLIRLIQRDTKITLFLGWKQIYAYLKKCFVKKNWDLIVFKHFFKKKNWNRN